MYVSAANKYMYSANLEVVNVMTIQRSTLRNLTLIKCKKKQKQITLTPTQNTVQINILCVLEIGVSTEQQ